MINKILNEVQAQLNTCPNTNDEIFLLIGHENYPKGSNISATGIAFYDKYNINSVAFLSHIFSLPLFSIISLILQSHRDAALLVDNLLTTTNGMYLFATYLQDHHRLFLINEFDNESNIQKIISDYPKHKILLIGSEHMDYPSEIQSTLMRIPHPGNQAYVNKAKDCCCTYFTHTFKDPNSTLSLDNFKIQP